MYVLLFNCHELLQNIIIFILCSRNTSHSHIYQGKKLHVFFKFWYHKANKYPFHRCDQTNHSRKQEIIPSVEKKLRIDSVLVQLVLIYVKVSESPQINLSYWSHTQKDNEDNCICFSAPQSFREITSSHDFLISFAIPFSKFQGVLYTDVLPYFQHWRFICFNSSYESSRAQWSWQEKSGILLPFTPLLPLLLPPRTLITQQ